MGRLCIYCEHFKLETDGPYSVQTPGLGYEILCGLGRFFMIKEEDKKEFRKNLEIGLTCKDFEPAKD